MTKEKAPDLPPGFDPARPLENAEHETFARLLVAETPAYVAYQKAKGGRIPNVTARSAASRWKRLPEIAARLKMLHLHNAEGSKKPPEATETQQTKPAKRNIAAPLPASPTTEAMGRAELYALITAEIRAGRVDPALVSSLLKVAPELGEVDQSRPDPTAVISYVCHFAGRPGDEIARELGGLEFIAAKLCDVLKVSPADLASVLLTKGHGKGHEVQNPQAGIESPLNTQSNGAADHAPIAGEAQDATT